MKVVDLKTLPFEKSSHTTIDKLSKKVFIKNKEIPHLTQFAQGYFKPGSIVPKHKHTDMYEIFLVEKGSITFIVNSKRIQLPPGQTIIIDPGDEHEVINETNKEVTMTYFSIQS